MERNKPNLQISWKKILDKPIFSRPNFFQNDILGLKPIKTYHVD